MSNGMSNGTCSTCKHFDGVNQCRRVIDKRGKGLKVGFPDRGSCLYYKPKGAENEKAKA